MTALDGMLRPLIDRISAIQAQQRGAPHFEWGTVTQASPLQVRLDGDQEPLLGTPSTLVKYLNPGDRVRVEIQNRRATIIGKASETTPFALYSPSVDRTYFGGDGSGEISGASRTYLGLQHGASGAGNAAWITVNGTQALIVRADGDIITPGRFLSSQNQKILWTGSSYVSDTQTINLSEGISAQPNGVILAWSQYSGGSNQNYGWNYTFIPRSAIPQTSGTGTGLQLSAASTTIALKYIYISNTSITGHTQNNQSPQTGYVLRYVAGV